MKFLKFFPHRFTKAEEVSEDESRSISSSTVAPACPRRRVQEAQCLAQPLQKSLTGTAGRKNISNTAWEKVSHHEDGALEN